MNTIEHRATCLSMGRSLSDALCALNAAADRDETPISAEVELIDLKDALEDAILTMRPSSLGDVAAQMIACLGKIQLVAESQLPERDQAAELGKVRNGLQRSFLLLTREARIDPDSIGATYWLTDVDRSAILGE